MTINEMIRLFEDDEITWEQLQGALNHHGLTFRGAANDNNLYLLPVSTQQPQRASR